MRRSLRTGREELTALRFAILGGDFCIAAAAGNLNASDCLPDRDFHSFAGKHRIREPFLAQFFENAGRYLVNNFFFAAASSLRLSAPTLDRANSPQDPPVYQ
jgi:hypothetical protein